METFLKPTQTQHTLFSDFTLKLIKFSLPGTSKGGDPAPKRILQDVQTN